jgi:circadian clock protein KaiB
MDYAKLPQKWTLLLYVASMTPAAKKALDNIRTICEKHLSGNYSLDIVDLLENPAVAEGEGIFAVPTLVRQFPLPLRKIIGDLSESEKVLAGLDIPADTAA